MLIRRVSHEAHIRSPDWHSAWRIAWFNGRNREWCHLAAWKIIKLPENQQLATRAATPRSAAKWNYVEFQIPRYVRVSPIIENLFPSIRNFRCVHQCISTWKARDGRCAEEVGTGPGPKHSILLKTALVDFGQETASTSLIFYADLTKRSDRVAKKERTHRRAKKENSAIGKVTSNTNDTDEEHVFSPNRSGLAVRMKPRRQKERKKSKNSGKSRREDRESINQIITFSVFLLIGFHFITDSFIFALLSGIVSATRSVCLTSSCSPCFGSPDRLVPHVIRDKERFYFRTGARRPGIETSSGRFRHRPLLAISYQIR